MRLTSIADRRLAAVAAVMAAVAVGQAAPSAAAVRVAHSPSWRIVKIYSVASGVTTLDSVDAVSASDAWLAGEIFPAAARRAPVLVQRWTQPVLDGLALGHVRECRGTSHPGRRV